MDYVKEQINGRRAAWVGTLQGEFTRNILAVGAPAYVHIPAFSDTGTEEVEWGPAIWSPQWGASLPLRGDMALIVFDNNRRPWVISWVPAVYVPAGGGGGGGTADIKYTFTQTVASATWTIVHSLGVFPAVTIVDNSGNVVHGDIVYSSSNQIVVTFDTAQAGKAYLS